MMLPSILSKQQKNDLEKHLELKDLSVENYYSSLPESMLISAKLGFAYVINEPLLEVGGDGFWIHEENHMIYFAVFDCMGHGRIASMMTRLYIQFLEDFISRSNNTTPSELITDLHKRVKEQFEKKIGHHLGTGADIGILKIDKKKKTMLYSGAKMDLVTVDKKGINRVKSNKRAIGQYFEIDRTYTDHQISLKNVEDTKYYLFSDGVTDLFGGPKHKKLRFEGFESILLKLKSIDILKEAPIMKWELKQWEGTSERLDDLLLIGFKVVV